MNFSSFQRKLVETRRRLRGARWELPRPMDFQWIAIPSCQRQKTHTLSGDEQKTTLACQAERANQLGHCFRPPPPITSGRPAGQPEIQSSLLAAIFARARALAPMSFDKFG